MPELPANLDDETSDFGFGCHESYDEVMFGMLMNYNYFETLF